MLERQRELKGGTADASRQHELRRLRFDDYVAKGLDQLKSPSD
jgi:hypothetical protein